MNFSFIIKSVIISFFVFLIIYATAFVSTQKSSIESNNYGVKDAVKESLDIAYYRKTGDIRFHTNKLIYATIENYVRNNNIDVDKVSFDIAVNEEQNIVTIRIYNSKDMLAGTSDIDYTFSYQVVEK